MCTMLRVLKQQINWKSLQLFLMSQAIHKRLITLSTQVYTAIFYFHKIVAAVWNCIHLNSVSHSRGRQTSIHIYCILHTCNSIALHLKMWKMIFLFYIRKQVVKMGWTAIRLHFVSPVTMSLFDLTVPPFFRNSTNGQSHHVDFRLSSLPAVHIALPCLVHFRR